MIKRLLPVTFLFALQTLQAQTPDSLIGELRAVNAAVTGPNPAPGKHLLLSNRALNLFLSEGAGYYLSSPDDLTLYKNSVIANAAGGSLAIYHNLRQPPASDESIRSFFSFGVKADVADAYNASSTGKPYTNRLGFMFKQTWIGRPRVSATAANVRTMDALRAGILHSLEHSIRKKAAEEIAALDAIDTTPDTPGQDKNTARNIAWQKFCTDLQQEIELAFAHAQAEALAQTVGYRVVAFNWTSISAYIPVITENFQTAATAGADPVNRHAWPLHLNLTHTRLWEGSSFGRLFLTLAGDLTLNNSRDAEALMKTGNLYTGDYHTFLTPAVKGQIIYLPTGSHFGISFLLQQSIGDYHALDGILGLPLVLIDKKGEPAVNFEFQVRFYDMGHTIVAGTGGSGHTAVGLTVGIPFSKIAY